MEAEVDLVVPAVAAARRSADRREAVAAASRNSKHRS